MPCTWLKSKREAMPEWSQLALGKAVNKNEKAIQRWENCKPEASKEVPYEALAAALGVSAVGLCEDHLRDLEAGGPELETHAEKSREALLRLRRERCFPEIDPAPIQACLEACSGTQLSQAITEHRPALADAREQAIKFADWLSRGRLDAFVDAVNNPLLEAIDRAGDRSQQAAIWHFLKAVIQSCAALDTDVSAAGRYGLHGEDKAWPYRALIDNATNLNGMRFVKPMEKAPPHRLDDSRDSTRAVKFGDVTQRSADGRVHELVAELSATLALDPPPPVSDEKGFETFCATLNRELWNENALDTHVFGLCEQGNREPEEVKAKLMRLLPDLRLFDCGDSGGESTVLRVDRDKLEVWYARHLNELQQRGFRPDARPKAAESDQELTEGEANMHTANNPSVTTNVNVQVGSNNASAQTQGAGDIIQTHAMGATEDLAQLLDRILADTSDRKQETKELRQAARDAQGELENERTLSAKTKAFLKKAIEALPATDKLLTTGNKLADLLAKLPDLGG